MNFNCRKSMHFSIVISEQQFLCAEEDFILAFRFFEWHRKALFLN